MKLTPFLTVLSALTFASTSLQARDDLLELVPNDAWLVMEVRDLKGFQEDIKASPLKELWEKTIAKWMDVNHMLEWMDSVSEDKFSEEDRVVRDTLKEFSEKYTSLQDELDGQILFSLGGDMKEMALNAIEDGEDFIPEVFALAHTKSSPEDLEDLFTWLEEKNKEVGDDPDTPLFFREEIEGTKVYFLNSLRTTVSYSAKASKSSDDILPETEGDLDVSFERELKEPQPEKQIGVFIFKGVLGVCLGQDKIVDLLQNLEEGDHPENILETYENSLEEIGRGDFSLFANAIQLGDLVEEIANHEKAKFPENPMKVTTKSLLNALQLDGLQNLAMSADITPEGMDMSSALYLKHRKGIWGFLDLYEGEAKLPPFVPDNVMTTTAAAYDMGRIWETLDGILLNISPVMKGMLDFQIQILDQTHKINIREDLFANLGDQFTTFSWLPDLGEDESFDEALENIAGRDFYAISLKDGERFERSLQQVVKAMMKDKVKTREHQGVDIHFLPIFGETYFSYSITQNWLLISVGPPSDINQVVQDLRKASTKQLWNQTHIQAALREAPTGVVQWDYADLEEIPDFLGNLFNGMLEEQFDKSFLDEDLPALPFFILSWSKDYKDRVISKASLFPKDQ